MIRVLILYVAWREHSHRPRAANNVGQLNCMGGANFQMRVAVKFDELNRGTKQSRRFHRFSGALFGCAFAGRVAQRTDNTVSRASGANFLGNHSAAAKLDVIGMRAES
jgi:hypothetical protein